MMEKEVEIQFLKQQGSKKTIRKIKSKNLILLVLLFNVLCTLVIFSIFGRRDITLVLDIEESIEVAGNSCPIFFPPFTYPSQGFDTPLPENTSAHLLDFLDRRRQGHLDNIPLYFLQDHLRILDPGSTICEEFDNEDLIIVVSSDCGSVDRREAIRVTWGSTASELGVPVVFFVGVSNGGYCNAAIEEMMMYGDVVVGNFLDAYSNMTLKTVAIVNWVRQQCRQNFVLRTYDDVVVNVSNILKFVYEERDSIVGGITGALTSNRSVERIGRRYVPKLVYPSSKYPDYLLGSGYMISSKILNDLYYGSLIEPYFPLEDVFLTGIVAKSLDIKLVNERRLYFPYSQVDYCSFQRIFLKQVDEGAQLRNVWEAVHKPSDCKVFDDTLKANPNMQSYFNTSERSNFSLEGEVVGNKG